MLGIQKPNREANASTNKGDALTLQSLLSIVDIKLDDWQMHVLDNGTARTDDRWERRFVGVSVPRQQGKTVMLEARALAGVLLYGEKTVIVCAHEVRTTLEMFNRLAGYFDNIPDLKAMHYKTVRRGGDEAIILKNGCRIKFISRSGSAGRGFTADALLLDEGQILPDEAWNALLPTTTAAPDAQIWLFGTPPGPNDKGEVFTRLRHAALAGNWQDTYFAEWSADPEADFDDPAVWAMANPALGTRVKEETIRSARASMSDEAFGREVLGIWGAQTSKSVIPIDVWTRRATDDVFPEHSPKWLAIDVSPDRSHASIGVVEAHGDGHVAYIGEHLNGTHWIVDWIASRIHTRNIQAVAIDTAGPAASMIDPLRQRGVRIIPMTTNDVKSACGRFFDAVMSEQLTHLGDPLLNAAVSGANKRTLNDAWAWNKKNESVDITPLVAVTYAYWLTGKDLEPKKTTQRVSNTFYALN